MISHSIKYINNNTRNNNFDFKYMILFKTYILFNCVEYLIKKKKFLVLSNTFKTNKNIINFNKNLGKIKNYKKNIDPVYITETYLHLRNWILGFSEFYKDYFLKFLSPLAVLIFIKLLNKKFYTEAKLFFITLNLKFRKSYYLKRLYSNFNFFEMEKKKIKFSNKKKILMKFSVSSFNILVKFLEENYYLHFLEYIHKYFLVKFSSNIYQKIENFKNKHTELPKYYTQKIISYKILKIAGKNLDSFNSISISSDENTIVSGLDDSSIRVFDFINESKKNKNFSLIGHSTSISNVKISHCNNFIISCSVNGEIKLWSLRYKKLLANYENINTYIWDVCFSNCDSFFSTAYKNSLCSLWTTERIFPLRFFVGHKLDVNVTRWNSLGNIMATGSDDQTVRLWDLKSAKSIATLKSFNAPVYNIEFSPDGNEICLSGITKYIEIWDIRADKVFKRLQNKNCTKIYKNIAYSLNGQTIVYNINSNTINILSKNFLYNDKSKYFGFKKNQSVYACSANLKITKIYQIKFNSDQKITIVGV